MGEGQHMQQEVALKRQVSLCLTAVLCDNRGISCSQVVCMRCLQVLAQQSNAARQRALTCQHPGCH
jgi:hypothetical protein